MVHELFRQSGPKLACDDCGRMGLVVHEAEVINDEEWGEARKCDSCGSVIPAERLEVFPDATRCASCQSHDDRSSDEAESEYCPECGDVMRAVSKTGRGLAGYRMVCPSCRR